MVSASILCKPKIMKVERNYSTREREALGMIYFVTKFRHYLLGNRFTFHVDHSTLLYLVNKPELIGKLSRWMLLLQEFDFMVVHRPGSMHAVADSIAVGIRRRTEGCGR